MIATSGLHIKHYYIGILKKATFLAGEPSSV